MEPEKAKQDLTCLMYGYVRNELDIRDKSVISKSKNILNICIAYLFQTLQDEATQVFEKINTTMNVPFVIYSNQTAIFLKPKDGDNDGNNLKGKGKQAVISEANEIMKEYGPVYAGTQAGDFNSLPLKEEPGFPRGYLVTGWCPIMYTFVSKLYEMPQGNILTIGLFGRSKRNKDGKECKPVYWDDTNNRGPLV